METHFDRQEVGRQSMIEETSLPSGERVETSHRLGYLVSADYDSEERRVQLKFYDPQDREIFLWDDPTGHKPYMYSKESRETLREKPAISENSSVVRIEEESKYDPIEDRQIDVSKVLTTDPLAVGGTAFSLREKMKAWEADIKYYVNYIFDLGLEVGRPYSVSEAEVPSPLPVEPEPEVLQAAAPLLESADEEDEEDLQKWLEILSTEMPPYKVVAFDIEIYTEEGDRLPMAEEAKDPIIAVSLRGSDDTRKVLLYDMNGEVEPTELEDLDFQVEVFAQEEDLVRRCTELLQKYPFVITFNGDNFDFPYFYNRAVKLGLTDEDLRISLGRRDARVDWGVHLDLYKFFFNRAVKGYVFSDKYDRVSLEEVSQSLLDQGKTEESASIPDLSPSDLVRYSFRDSELTYRLATFNNELVLTLVTMIARISNMTLDDVCRLSVSNWIKNRLYHIHRERNYLIPLREEIKEKGEKRYTDPVTKGKKYIGAIVVEPEPGSYFGVTVLDFSSLYPSIMKEFNISYETVNCSHEQCTDNTVPGTGHYVCTKNRGIISRFVGHIRDLRVEVFKRLWKETSEPQKSEFYNSVQNALKVIINASYGVVGSERFPFYYLPAAESVTMLGRKVIQDTIDEAEELGIDVIYGDTDSLFLHNPVEESLKRLQSWVQEEFNLDLEVEKKYRYVALSSRKKNYFGVLEDGSVDVKGLVGKKRNTPQFIKDAFYEAVDILRQVQSPDDFEESKKQIQDLVYDAEEKINRGEVPLEDLAVATTLGKKIKSYTKTTPQHVKAAKLIQRNGDRKVRAGETIRYVKTDTKLGVKPLSMCEPGDVNTEKYVEMLRSALEQLVDAIGVELRPATKGYSKLESFM